MCATGARSLHRSVPSATRGLAPWTRVKGRALNNPGARPRLSPGRRKAPGTAFTGTPETGPGGPGTPGDSYSIKIDRAKIQQGYQVKKGIPMCGVKYNTRKRGKV